jgi:curved DNA-binding protein
MAKAKDYYQVLGLTKAASAAEIKKAYRKMAMKHHPDRNKGDKKAETLFKEVSEAYAVLSDTEKRKQYDMFGADGFRQRYSQEDIYRGVNFDDVFQGTAFGDDIFSTIFGAGGPGGRRGGKGGFTASGGPGGARGFDIRDVFGGGRSGGRPPKGADLELNLPVTVEEAYRGGKKTVRYRTAQGEKEVVVTIPKGITVGKKLRLPGKGSPGPAAGIPPGDLYFIISFEAHPIYECQGEDLILRREIPYSQVALGTTLEVPTLDGVKKVKIPPGTQPQTRIRLPGYGLCGKGEKKGHMYLIVVPRVPRKLSAGQKKLLQGLADEGL